MKPEPNYDPPSELFMDLVCNGGTPVADCDWCGRVHFDANGEFMEEGELEDLLAKQKAEPEKYISHDGGIGFGEFCGKQTVWDCQCHRLRPYEDFIWNHRFLIARYLKARSEAALNKAKAEFEQLNPVPCNS